MRRHHAWMLVGLLVPLAAYAWRTPATAGHAPPAVAADLLEIEDDSLTDYQAGTTELNAASPQFLQRATQIDGSSRASMPLGMDVTANPFGSAHQGECSMGGVDLRTGSFHPTDVDIALPSEGGAAWIIGRNYNAVQIAGSAHHKADSIQGWNWGQLAFPEIVIYAGGTAAQDKVYLVAGADRYVEFTRNGANDEFDGRQGAAGVFQFVLGTGGDPDIYVLTDLRGTEYTFFAPVAANYLNGQLWKFEDAAGNLAYVGDPESAGDALTSGFDEDGRPLVAYDASGRRYTFSYTGTRLTQVIVEVKNGGTWTSPDEVAKVEYAYYPGGQNEEAHGSEGDLKTVTVHEYGSQSTGDSVRKRYYRYYKGTYHADTNPGYASALKYILDFEGARRFDLEEAGTGEPEFDDGFTSAAELDLEPYAAAYFEYDTSHRIRAAWFSGECGCGGGGDGLHEYTYEANPDFTPASGYQNDWERRAIVARPDGSYLVQYFDEVGQALHKVIAAGDPASTSPVYDRWVTRVDRNPAGLVSAVHTPAANATYVHDTSSSNWALTSESTAGLIWHFGYESTGPMRGFLKERKYSEGISVAQPKHFLESMTYTSTSVTIGSTSVTRPFIDVRKGFHGLSTDGSSGFDATDLDYTFHSGTLIPELVTTILPAVNAAKNGSGLTDEIERHYRLDGLLDAELSARGRITYREYASGQLTVEIQDADSSITGDFVGGSVPGGFSSGNDPLHHKTEYAYDAQGRRTTTTLPNGRVASQFYTKLADARRVTLSFPKFVAGSPDTYYGPVDYSVRNLAGHVEAQGDIGLSNGSATDDVEDYILVAESDPIAAVDVGTLVRLSTTLYSESGAHVEEQRVYFDIPSSGEGTSANYDATRYHEDDMGRVVRVLEPSSTIRRTVYDAMGRVVGRWMGTDDTGWPGGTVSGTDNMVRVEQLTYDGGGDGGNSHLTERRLHLDGTGLNSRAYGYTHDLRGRVLLETNPTSPHAMHAYDNLGRRTESGSFGPSAPSTLADPTSATTGRLALNESFFDERGQAWKTIRHKIDPSDGSSDDTLESLTWFDAEGRTIKVRGSQLAKTRYDGLGRMTHEFVLGREEDADETNVYAAAASIDDIEEIVLEEHQTVYESGSHNVLLSSSIARFHDDRGNGTKGELDTNADADPLKYTAANIKGRIQISAMWYDTLDRLTDEVHFGTYDGLTFDLGIFGSVPSYSDTALRTNYAYGLDGEVLNVTDPRELVQRTERDEAGRVVASIRNYVGGAPTGSDQNVTVRYEYENGLRTKLIADLPSPATDQVTLYIHGTTAGTPAASMISTGHLPRGTVYPDSTNTGTTEGHINSDASDVVSYAYNAQGQEVRRQDQAGNVFESIYDTAGRLTQSRVTTLGSGFDGDVRRIQTTYDDLGRHETVTQFSAATNGTVLDQVGWEYDGWSNLMSHRQDVDSVLDEMTPENEYAVNYTWAMATGGRNTLRRTTIGLPSGASVLLEYLSNNNRFDDAVSRATTLKHGATRVALYDYNGLGQVVATDYLEPEVRWLFHEGGGSGIYPDLDRFNRVEQSRWTAYHTTPVDFYSVDLGYDENSNITWARDNVHVGFDVGYGIDDVDRLTLAKEGTLSSGSISNPPSRSQEWELDHVGNWKRDKLDLDGDGVFTGPGEWNDCRTHNGVNELEARDLDCTPGTTGDNIGLTYDAAGNLIDDGQEYKYVYDAFYRLRQILNKSNELVSEHRYNGLGHRIAVLVDTDDDGKVDDQDGDEWEHLVYDERWRLVTKFWADQDAPHEEFLHHQAGLDGQGGSSYIDLVVLRDRDTGVNGSLNERIYYCQNWRADVSALVSSDGEMLEWVKYSAYGVPFGLPAGDTDSDGDRDQDDRDQIDAWAFVPTYDVRGDLNLDGVVDSADKVAASGDAGLGRNCLGGLASNRGYAGYVWSESASACYVVRHRFFDAELGRWLQRDPLGYTDGMGLATYCAGMPGVLRDPYGLSASYIACILKCTYNFAKCVAGTSPQAMQRFVSAISSDSLDVALINGLQGALELGSKGIGGCNDSYAACMNGCWRRALLRALEWGINYDVWRGWPDDASDVQPGPGTGQESESSRERDRGPSTRWPGVVPNVPLPGLPNPWGRGEGEFPYPPIPIPIPGGGGGYLPPPLPHPDPGWGRRIREGLRIIPQLPRLIPRMPVILPPWYHPDFGKQPEYICMTGPEAVQPNPLPGAERVVSVVGMA